MTTNRCASVMSRSQGRPWMAHPRKDDVRRLAAESALFVLGLIAIVVLIGLAGPA